MSINWIRRMGMARLVALAVLSLFIGSAVIESAEARPGRSRGGMFRSFGDRGSRTTSPDAAGRMQPIAPNQARPNNNGFGANNPAQAGRGSWFQRNPLMTGIIGAIAGTVLGGMLMNALGGIGGLSTFVGVIMIALFALALFAAFRLFKASKQTALSGGMSGNNMSGNGMGMSGAGMPGRTTYDAPRASQEYQTPYSQTPYSGAVDAPPVYSQTREQGLAAITLEDSTMTGERLQDALSSRFFQIQEAWSTADRSALMAATTKTVFDEFKTDLDELERNGERNIIKNIVIRSFEVTEAWQEVEWEFVTARITARLLDYTEKVGKVVDGDAVNPVNFSEYWTFVRPRGKGEWRLSAINQEA